MFGSELVDSAIDELVALDVDTLCGADAAALTRELARLKRRLGAFELACARRAVDNNGHVGSSARDSADWFARINGTSVSEARRSLDTARELETQPEVAEALSSGRVSEEQAQVIATAGPAANKKLLASAPTQSLQQLRDEARRLNACGESGDQRRKRMLARRSHRRWTDDLGMLCGSYCLLPEEGAVLEARLRRKTDEVFRTSQRTDEHRQHQQYEADAFVSFFEQDASGATRCRAELVVIADYEALIRGHTEPGETCEVEGVGPIPVSVAEQIRNDCYLSVILRRGGKPALVTGKGHYIPARLRMAVKMRDRRCQIPGCGSTFGLEIDHTLPVAKGGETELANLWLLCRRHHRRKTGDDFGKGGKQWSRETIATLFDTG